MRKYVKICIVVVIIFFVLIYVLKDDKAEEKINELMKYENNIEKYVKECVGDVLDTDIHYELIKTMCVIIRTCYMYEKTINVEQMENIQWNSMFIQNENKNKGKNIEIDSSMKNKINKAAKETRGEIMVYNENIIYPFFHYVSPGETRNEEKVLGINIPYLKIKDCRGDIKSKDFIQIKYFNKKDIIKIVELNNKNDIKNGDIKVVKKDKYGYVYDVKVDNKYSLDVYNLVSKLGLNSTNFTISTYTENKDIVRFVCRGKGSGMGLSIFDANKLAREGLNYNEIINAYYKDIIIKKYVY